MPTIAYGYSYDHLSRLATANYTYNDGSNWVKAGADYSVNGLQYDEHSNIQAMQVKTSALQQTQTADNLNYSYASNSNRLQSVTDAVGAAEIPGAGKTFKDGNTSGSDYIYDAAGNIIEDRNKRITIQWNYLVDKPALITYTPPNGATGGGTISYVYDASGEQLRKTVSINNSGNITTTTWNYSGGFVYRKTIAPGGNGNPADSLLYFNHQEGRVRMKYYRVASGAAGDAVYDYMVSDYLGNTRMVLTEEQDIASYVATHETPVNAAETAIFGDKLNSTREPLNNTFPYYNSSSNQFHVRLNGSDAGRRTGESVVLKVMSGDALTVAVKAFYRNNGNQAFFGDPYSLSNFGKDLLMGGLTGGLVNGGIAALRGNNFWSGSKGIGNLFRFDNQRALLDAGWRRSPVSGKWVKTSVIIQDRFNGVIDEGGTLLESFAGKRIGDVLDNGMAGSATKGELM